MKLHLSLRERALQIARFPSSPRLGVTVRHLLTLALVVVVFFGSAVQLRAKEKKELDIVLTAHRVVTDAAGIESFSDATDAAPGDIVQYTAIFLNAGDKKLQHLQPTLPIPAGMEYVPASAAPAVLEASLDGRAFAAVPLIMERKLERGVEIFVEFSPRIYRALRWKVAELAPGESVTMTARAVVLAVN